MSNFAVKAAICELDRTSGARYRGRTIPRAQFSITWTSSSTAPFSLPASRSACCVPPAQHPLLLGRAQRLCPPRDRSAPPISLCIWPLADEILPLAQWPSSLRSMSLSLFLSLSCPRRCLGLSVSLSMALSLCRRRCRPRPPRGPFALQPGHPHARACSL